MFSTKSSWMEPPPTDDFVNRLSDFITEFDERFNADISDEALAKCFIPSESNN